MKLSGQQDLGQTALLLIRKSLRVNEECKSVGIFFLLDFEDSSGKEGLSISSFGQKDHLNRNLDGPVFVYFDVNELYSDC